MKFKIRNKARLIEKIAELVKEKTSGRYQLHCVMNLDKDGMRIVIEVKTRCVGRSGTEQPLSADTDADHARVNMVALHQGQPEDPQRKEISGVCAPPP